MQTKKTLKLVMAALLAAMTCVATMVIKIPLTATGGYINLGDCIVLLSGILLGQDCNNRSYRRMFHDCRIFFL